MKLPKRPARVPAGSVCFYPEGTPKAFIVERKYLSRIRLIRWHYIEKKNRARGFFNRTKTRQYLHRYILLLARKYYPEVTFGNGDPFDCRLVNLKPYRRYEEGARRQMFKNNTSKRKGVSFHKRKRKWIAVIRTRGRLKHLGYFRSADAAADAYTRAWNIAHPTLQPMPVRGR